MLKSFALIACLSVALTAAAQPAPPAPPPVAATDAGSDPRLAILKLLPAGSKLEDMRPSPIPGIYEFTQGAEISYITSDGKFFLDGNVYDMHSRENLTEQVRTHARLAMINAVPESQMLMRAAHPQLNYK